uniref:Uncharacterized protein n=1 Tax=Anguilla anguilla TaxID=7936 RepID=A0A0E9XM36_ANGAN
MLPFINPLWRKLRIQCLRTQRRFFFTFRIECLIYTCHKTSLKYFMSFCWICTALYKLVIV